jgi:hypothetical protein
MTVIPLEQKAKPPSKIWVCDCGCENFWLYQDGRVECVECNTIHDTMTGYWKIIDPDGPVLLREKPNAGEDQERQEDGGS